MKNEEYKKLSIAEFTKAAGRYESNHAGIYEMCKKDYPDILEELEKEPFRDLLDAGCGPAPMISLLAEKYPDRHYTGLDLTPAMIEQAKKKNISNATFVVGDCENFPFENDSFDAIICSMSFHHYPDPQAFFDSVKRCLRPNGRLILRDVTSDNKVLVWLMNTLEMPLANICGHGDVRVPTRDVVMKCCRKVGLKVEKFEIRKGMRMHCVVRKARRRLAMKFYESGDNRKPVIFLFPGTCCLYNSFDHVLDGLHSYFYTVAVSYDGFDSNEKTEFYSMEDECEKIEQEIRTKYGGRIKAAYGCSLGGSFVSLLIQRKRIHIDYGIIGSSDMDEAGNLVAKIQASMVVPFMYKMIHTGALPKFMQKKLNKTDGAKKELYNGFLNMFGIGKGGSPWITKQSIYNQFYSDLVTKVQHGIDVPGTTIHVFYATKMGKKYEKRYCTYFKNPDIQRHNMQHEELFCCHSAEWVEEVRKAVEGDKQ